jgi:hypothetical protein
MKTFEERAKAYNKQINKEIKIMQDAQPYKIGKNNNEWLKKQIEQI